MIIAVFLDLFEKPLHSLMLMKIRKIIYRGLSLSLSLLTHILRHITQFRLHMNTCIFRLRPVVDTWLRDTLHFFYFINKDNNIKEHSYENDKMK
jgi:hypothetical protein